MPADRTPEAMVYCALTCTRLFDFFFTPGGPGSTVGFPFAFGLTVDPSGNLLITDDPSGGARGGRGHAWIVPFVP